MTLLHIQIGLKTKETSSDLRFEIRTRQKKNLSALYQYWWPKLNKFKADMQKKKNNTHKTKETNKLTLTVSPGLIEINVYS